MRWREKGRESLFETACRIEAELIEGWFRGGYRLQYLSEDRRVGEQKVREKP